MKYLTTDQLTELYLRVMKATGGSVGLRDAAGLDSALAQPRMTFGGDDLYPTLVEKAAALAFSLIKNHPFVDGNKRIGFAALDAFLRLNDRKAAGPAEDWEAVILGVASGEMGREAFADWLRGHVVERGR